MAPSWSACSRWNTGSASARSTRSSAHSLLNSSRSKRPELFASQATKAERSRASSLMSPPTSILPDGDDREGFGRNGARSPPRLAAPTAGSLRPHAAPRSCGEFGQSGWFRHTPERPGGAGRVAGSGRHAATRLLALIPDGLCQPRSGDSAPLAARTAQQRPPAIQRPKRPRAPSSGARIHPAWEERPARVPTRPRAPLCFPCRALEPGFGALGVVERGKGRWG